MISRKLYVQHAGALPESLQNTSSEKKKDDDDAKDAKDPRRCRSKSPLRRVFLEPRSLRKIFLGTTMSSALSFVREKKTFEEEEEERKISLADSSVFFRNINKRRKKKKEKKGRKKNATNTQVQSIALSGSRALFLFLFLSPDGTKSLRVSTIRPLYLFHLQSLK